MASQQKDSSTRDFVESLRRCDDEHCSQHSGSPVRSLRQGQMTSRMSSRMPSPNDKSPSRLEQRRRSRLHRMNRRRLSQDDQVTQSQDFANPYVRHGGQELMNLSLSQQFTLGQQRNNSALEARAQAERSFKAKFEASQSGRGADRENEEEHQIDVGYGTVATAPTPQLLGALNQPSEQDQNDISMQLSGTQITESNPTERSGLTEMQRSYTHTEASKRRARGKLNQRERPTSKATKYGVIDLNQSMDGASFLRKKRGSFQRGAVNQSIEAANAKRSVAAPAKPAASSSATPQKLGRTASQGIEVYVKRKPQKAGPGHTRSNTQLSQPQGFVPAAPLKKEQDVKVRALSRKHSQPTSKTKPKHLSSANLKKLESNATNKRNKNLEKPLGAPDQWSFGESPGEASIGQAHVYPAYQLEKETKAKVYNDEPLITDSANGSATFSYFNPAANVDMVKNDYVDTFYGTFNSGVKSVKDLADGGNSANQPVDQSFDYSEANKDFQHPIEDTTQERHCAKRHHSFQGAEQQISETPSRATSQHSDSKSGQQSSKTGQHKRRNLGLHKNIESKSRGRGMMRTNPDKFKSLIEKNLQQQSRLLNEQSMHSRNDPSVGTTAHDNRRKQQSSLDMVGQIQEISPFVGDSVNNAVNFPQKDQFEQNEAEQQQPSSAQFTQFGGEEEGRAKEAELDEGTEPVGNTPNRSFDDMADSFNEHTPVRSISNYRDDDQASRKPSVDRATQTPGSRCTSALNQEIESPSMEKHENRAKSRGGVATRRESSERPTSLGTRRSNQESKEKLGSHALEGPLTALPTMNDVLSYQKLDESDPKGDSLPHTPRQTAQQRISQRSSASPTMLTPSKRSPNPKSPLQSQLIVQENISPREHLQSSRGRMAAATDQSTSAYNTKENSPLTKRTLTAQMAMQECISPEPSPLRTSRAQGVPTEISMQEATPTALEALLSNANQASDKAEVNQAQEAPMSPVSGTPSPSKLTNESGSLVSGKGKDATRGERSATQRFLGEAKNVQQVRQTSRTTGSKDTRRAGTSKARNQKRSSINPGKKGQEAKPAAVPETERAGNGSSEQQPSSLKSTKMSSRSTKKEQGKKPQSGESPMPTSRPSPTVQKQSDLKSQESKTLKTQASSSKNINKTKQEPVTLFNDDSRTPEELGAPPDPHQAPAESHQHFLSNQATPNDDEDKTNFQMGETSAFEDQTSKEAEPTKSDRSQRNTEQLPQPDVVQFETKQDATDSGSKPKHQPEPIVTESAFGAKREQERQKEGSLEEQLSVGTPDLETPLLNKESDVQEQEVKVEDELDQKEVEAERDPDSYEPPEVQQELPKADSSSDYAKQRKIAYAQVPVIGLPPKHEMPTRRPSLNHPDEQKDCHHHKMILLGGEDVGKTSLFLRYMYHAPKTNDATLVERSSSSAAYVFSRATETDDGIRQFNMWDISYKEGFIQNIREYYDRVESACVVFDVSNRASFEEAKEWALEMKDIAKQVFLAANKTDLEGGARVVSKEEAQEFSRAQGLRYYEVSANLNVGLEELFRDLESENSAAPTPTPASAPKVDLSTQQSGAQSALAKQEQLCLQLASLNFECDIRVQRDTTDAAEEDHPFFRHLEKKTKQGDLSELQEIEHFLPKLVSIKERLDTLLGEGKRMGLDDRVEYTEALQKQKQIEDIVEGLDTIRESESKKRRHRCLMLAILLSILLVALYGVFDNLEKLGVELPVYRIHKPTKPAAGLYEEAQLAEANVYAYESSFIKKVKLGLGGFVKLVQAHREVMQQNVDEFNKIPRTGADAFDQQVQGLEKLLAGEQHFTTSRLLNVKKIRDDSVEVYTLYEQVSALGITRGRREQNQLLVDKYSLDAFLRQREFLGNILQLAAFDLQKAIHFYKSRVKSPEENFQWLQKQYKFFEDQVDSAMKSAKNVIKQLDALTVDFQQQMATLDSDLLSIRSLQRVSKKNGFDTEQRISQCRASCQLSDAEVCSSDQVKFRMPGQHPLKAQLQMAAADYPNEDELNDRLAKISRVNDQASALERNTQETARDVSKEVLVHMKSRPQTLHEQTLFREYALKVCALAQGMRQYDLALAAERARKQAKDEEAQSSATMTLVIFVLSCCLAALSLILIICLVRKQIMSQKAGGKNSRSADDVEREIDGLLKPILH